MSTTSGCPLVQLALAVKYPLPESGNGAPVFTGDLLPSNRAACSLDPFALWTVFPSSWWRVAATTTTGPPPRPDGNSGRCACPEQSSAGTAGTLPTFTHMPVGRVGAQLYPGDIAARYRNTARGLARPSDNRTGETAPTNNEDRASQQPIAASFGAAVLYRGF
jgi:hypothetical protein